MVIKRYSFAITRWNLTKDFRCPVCGHDIAIKGKLHSSGQSVPFALF
jgi:DNA-directed RNA polymerase subunit RPC12/RpoP